MSMSKFASKEDYLNAEIERLKAMLIECRSSVKYDWVRYEQMALAKINSGTEPPQSPFLIFCEQEIERLHTLLEAIDAAMGEKK